MTKATKKLSLERLRRNLDASAPPPTRANAFAAVYTAIDRAQLCADPLGRLKEARQHLDALIASYEVRR